MTNSPTDIYAIMNARLVPYGVSVELTARCNLDCVHCYHVRTSGPEMTTDEVRRVFDDLAGIGTMELTLTGGEPLLREDFRELLVYAVRTTGFSVKLFSNLTLLDESTADLLASLPMNSVETTLLGPDEAIHDAIACRPGAFRKTVDAIGMLKRRSVQISAKTVIIKPNRRFIDDMYRLAYDIGVPFRHDDCVFVESGGSRVPLSLQIPDDEIRRLRKSIGQPVERQPGVCNIAKSVMSVGPDGCVYPCGAFPESAGNVRESALRDIWYDSPVMQRVRAIRDADYTVCASCPYRIRCNGCVAMGIGLSLGRKYPCHLARRRLRHLS